jgi:hypothetical protein
MVSFTIMSIMARRTILLERLACTRCVTRGRTPSTARSTARIVTTTSARMHACRLDTYLTYTCQVRNVHP